MVCDPVSVSQEYDKITSGHRVNIGHLTLDLHRTSDREGVPSTEYAHFG